METSRRLFSSAFLGLVFFVLLSSLSQAATYYIRTDGGTAGQCRGTADVPYPGSGTNQPCAWSHPYWALDGGGNWIIQGGDTLLIHPGSYQMGFGSPNTGWCSTEATWDCHLPPLPSGPSSQSSGYPFPNRVLPVVRPSGDRLFRIPPP